MSQKTLKEKRVVPDISTNINNSLMFWKAAVDHFQRRQIIEGILISNPIAYKFIVMDFNINREEGVYPMVPAGKANTEMLLV